MISRVIVEIGTHGRNSDIALADIPNVGIVLVFDILDRLAREKVAVQATVYVVVGVDVVAYLGKLDALDIPLVTLRNIYTEYRARRGKHTI